MHAAGHAVALSLLGFTAFTVDLDADEAADSFTLTASPPQSRPLAALGVVIAAGPAAEVCWRRLRRVRPIGGKSAAELRGELARLEDDAFEVDVDDLHAVAGGQLDRHWPMLTSIAQALLLRRWPAVEAVAAELRRRRRMSWESIATFTHDTEHHPDRLAAALAPRSQSPHRRRTAAAP